MQGYIRAAVALIRAMQKVLARKWSFLGLFLLSFALSVWVLAAFDLLPNPPKAEVEPVASTPVELDPAAPLVAEEPTRIEAPSIKLSAAVSNPSSTAVAELDRELLSGAVRYPTAAKLGEDGNVVLFGHSSYLPIVANPAMKTFNNIQKLTVGAEIRVYGADTVYVYHVRSVEKENAETGAIPLSVSGKVLTLATCNSFGAKEDRFIVTADFVGSYPAAS